MPLPVTYVAGDVLTALQLNDSFEYVNRSMTLVTTVTISAAATTNVNSCFTSEFRNYLVTSNLTTSANTGVAVRLRASGTDNSTNSYNISYLYQSLSGVNNGYSQSANTSQFNMHISNVCRAINMNMLVANPQTTDYTTLSFNNIQADNGVSSFYSFSGGGFFNNTTQFDGFSIYTGGAPTISGTIRIYGLKNTV